MEANVKRWPRNEEGQIENSSWLLDVVREARSYEDQVELLEGLTHQDDLALYLRNLPIDPENRSQRIDHLERALAGIDDQVQLGAIAREFPDPRVRRQAVARLTLQSDLKDVAKRMDEDCETRLEAVSRINDQTWLENMARNMTTGCPELPVAAHAQLTAILAELASLADLPRDEEGRIIDQETLLQAIRHSHSYPQKEAVLAALTHQADLALYLLNLPESAPGDFLGAFLDFVELAGGFPPMEFPLEGIVARITDQELLRAVALGGKDSDVRREAAKRLTHESALKEVADKEDEYHDEVRMEAMAKITDQTWLEAMARNTATRCTELAVEAIARVTNLDVLAEIVREEMPLIVEDRKTAIADSYDDYYPEGHYAGFTAEDYRAEAARDAHRELALAALSRIQNQELLAEVIRLTTDDSWMPDNIRWNWMPDDSKMASAAIRNLTDQALLAEVIWMPNCDSEVVRGALKNLHDESLLTAIAIGFPDPDVAEQAILGVSNPEKLTQISQQAKEARVREIAQKRLA